MNGRTKQDAPAKQSGSQALQTPNRQKQEMNLVDDLGCYLKDYAKQRPEAAAMWCFGIGFVLGWKLKPW